MSLAVWGGLIKDSNVRKKSGTLECWWGHWSSHHSGTKQVGPLHATKSNISPSHLDEKLSFKSDRRMNYLIQEVITSRGLPGAFFVPVAWAVFW